MRVRLRSESLVARRREEDAEVKDIEETEVREEGPFQEAHARRGGIKSE